MANGNKLIGRAFVIRPFNKKKNANGEELDFENIHKQLIAPALAKAGLAGQTTTEFIYQGNIREDMFHELLVADVVIADISLHNANAFYELGIRHALRDRSTVLIKAEIKSDPDVFDLSTDRYLIYNPDKPQASITDLVDTIIETISRQRPDSPIFKLLPMLKPADPGTVIVIPLTFREEVEIAQGENKKGHLQLLAAEALGFPWESEGLRLVGRAQFKLKDFKGARTTWERFRQLNERDSEANQLLATIYQRLNELKKSDNAVERVLANADISGNQRAEMYSLRASNEKNRWRQSWQHEKDLAKRQQTALTSPHLDLVRELYDKGFKQDRNHYYAGLNALAMNVIGCELAKAHPDIWQAEFKDKTRARLALEDREDLATRLAAAIELAIETALEEHPEDEWARISLADLRLLVDTPKRITSAYRKAMTAASHFAAHAVRRQICLYQELDILQEQYEAALKVVPNPDIAEEPSPRVLLFTGHRVDDKNREQARFPNNKAIIEQARQLIQLAVSTELKRLQQENKDAPGEQARPVVAIAGGACGGDLLFHEICEELHIESHMFLALAPDNYTRESVVAGGNVWIDKFDRQQQRGALHILSDANLPAWLTPRSSHYTIWQRSNLWMLYSALAMSQERVTLISLYDGGSGSNPGGTEDMVARAIEHGARHVPIDARLLLNAADDPPVKKSAGKATSGRAKEPAQAATSPE
jgi:hypothetical protein